jgi:hypothetical protein
MSKDKNVKTVEQAVAEVTTIYEQNMEIHFHAEYGMDAVVVLYKNISGYKIGNDWFLIMDSEGTSHLHPADEIKYARHFNTVKGE